MYVSFPPLKTRAEMGVDLSQNSVGKEFEETKQLYEGKDLSDCFAMLHVNMNKVNREIDQVKEEVTEVKKTMAGLQSFAEFTNDSLKEIHEKTVPTLENSFDDKIQGEVGDWKNYFTVAQNEEFHKIYWERMKECVNGINLPMKHCGDIDFNFWSFVVDDMVEHLRYLREDFVVQESDIFICTYPRSGTNWTFEIVHMLLHGTTDFAPLSVFPDNLLPELLDRLPSPRVLCSHFPLEFLPPDVTRKAKVICVFRNPKDVAVSLHNINSHLNFLDYNAKWEDYLRLFLDGNVPCGSWFSHVRGWEKAMEEKKVKNIMSLKYEDIKHPKERDHQRQQNPYEEVKKIGRFLGIEEDVKLLFDITKKCDFKIQYKERTTNVQDIIAKLNKNTRNFLYRKGEIGDWKNYFTVAQNKEFDKIYKERMKGSKFTFEFS